MQTFQIVSMVLVKKTAQHPHHSHDYWSSTLNAVHEHSLCIYSLAKCLLVTGGWFCSIIIFSILFLKIRFSIELYPFQFLIDDRQAMFPVSWTFRGNCRIINFLNFFIVFCLWEPRRWRTGREKGCGQWHERRTLHTTVIESVCCPVCVQWIHSDSWNIWKKNPPK